MARFYTALVAMAIVLASVVVATPQQEPYFDVQCEADAIALAAQERMFVLSEGETFIDLVASPQEWRLLTDAGFACEVLARHESFRSTVPAGYQSLAEIYNRLNATAEAYPDIAQVVDMAPFPPGVSVLGNTMAILKISDNVGEDEDEPNFLINSEHHAREVVTPVIALYIIDQLTQNYATDPTIQAYVDNNQIFVAPLWNPDGYDFMYEVDYNWRKNRAENFDGSRGVDQNRNYDLGWNSTCGGSIAPFSDTYRGPSPASEPETQTMMSFSSGMNLNKQLDFHSYGREVLYGYDCTFMYRPLADFVEEEAIALSKQADYAIRVPSADGEHPQWNTKDVGSYAFLVETATSFQPPYTDAIAEAERVWPLVTAFLDRPFPVRGYITDSSSGEPVAAAFTVTDTSNGQDVGIQRYNNSFGFYTLFLPAGSYALNIAASGYQFAIVNFDVDTHVETLTLSIQLDPR